MPTNTELTPEQIAQLVKLYEAATPGPLGARLGSGGIVCTALASEHPDAFDEFVCDVLPDYACKPNASPRWEANRNFIEAIFATMPALIEMLAEKDRTIEVLTSNSQQWQTSCAQFASHVESLRADLQEKEAELKAANLELGEWRTSESAENIKRHMDALTSEAERRTHAQETCQRLAAELQQAHLRISELEKR